jgi:hypothetical protein
MNDPKGPNMEAIFDLAESLELKKEETEFLMTSIKDFMEDLIGDIIKGMDLSRDQAKLAEASLMMALGAMSNEEYMNVMANAFGGNMNMGPVNDMMNMDFAMPDLSAYNQAVYDDVTKFLEENIPKLEGVS